MKWILITQFQTGEKRTNRNPGEIIDNNEASRPGPVESANRLKTKNKKTTQWMSAFLFITTVGFLIISPPATGQHDSNSLSGKWILEPVLASDTATGKTPTLSFNMLTHTFAGFTGCNNMSGKFVVEDYHLSFNPRITLTKKMCNGYNEEEFVANLLRVTAYKIESGVLTLMIDNTPISKWVRKPRSKLVANRTNY